MQSSVLSNGRRMLRAAACAPCPARARPPPRPILPGMPTREATLRLFTALWPDRATRQALAACRDTVPWPPGARPTPTGKLHMTLHFLGAVPASQVPALQAALAVPVPAFDLRLDVVKAWPGGLVVLQPADVPAALAGLHAALGTALRSVGLPVEQRAFRPHVTLARHALASTTLPAVAAPLPWRVDGHALVHSTPQGRYRVLRHYRQEGAAR